MDDNPYLSPSTESPRERKSQRRFMGNVLLCFGILICVAALLLHTVPLPIEIAGEPFGQAGEKLIGLLFPIGGLMTFCGAVLRDEGPKRKQSNSGRR